jgi:hypothetical protein
MFTLRDAGLRQRRPWCDGKTRHKSRGAAEAAIRGLTQLHERASDVKWRRTLTGLVPYCCTTCHGWHVGHKP